MTGFQQRWFFDEMFSSQIMEMFDADNDGVFSPEEAVRQGAFVYLQDYNDATVSKIIKNERNKLKNKT